MVRPVIMKQSVTGSIKAEQGACGLHFLPGTIPEGLSSSSVSDEELI